MANLTNLIDKVRVELGDLGKSFVTQFVADGTTNRFKLHYAPLDGTTVTVLKNGVDISDNSSIEESTGVLVTDVLPVDGDEFTVSGNYYRYFTAQELTTLINTAIETHTARKTDSLGRELTIDTLPTVEDYPLVVYATTLALYTLATDAAFDIDIIAPDGVNIPRSERYRQLMQMVDTRKEQYRELCLQLGIGLYGIEVFTLRRISKMTNRYVPVYKPQEVDDRSHGQRTNVPRPTYGDSPITWPTKREDWTAYQNLEFQQIYTETANYAGKAFTAKLLIQRGSVQKLQDFDLSVDTSNTATITSATRTSGSSNLVLGVSGSTGWAVVGRSVFIYGVDDAVDGEYGITAVGSGTFTVVTVGQTTALSLTQLVGQAEDADSQKSYTFDLYLTKDQTRVLANRTWWSISTVDLLTDESVEIHGGHLFTQKASEVIL